MATHLHDVARVHAVRHVHAVACAGAVIAMVLCAAPARAQSEDGRTNDLRGLHRLLGAEAILHSIDMVSTAYDLRLGTTAREANPLLAPFSQRPVALVSVSSAINALQMYTITRLSRNHPKLAVAWTLIAIGTEAYAVTNNIKIAGQLRSARAGTPGR